MRGRKKHVYIAIIVMACVVIGAGYLAVAGRGEPDESAMITTLSIDSIAEKFHNEDGYYLTVALEDWLIEEYHLSYDRISIKTQWDIYDKASPGDGYAGVTLKIREPEKCSNGGVREVLQWDLSDLCDIISLN